MPTTTSTGNVIISGPATLGGIGSVGGSTTISGTLAPGNGIGTLAFGNNLTFNTGSVFSWEFTANESGRGGNYDAVNIAGTFGGSNAIFRTVLTTGNFADAFWTLNRTWTDIFTDASGTTPLSFASAFSGIEVWQGNTDITGTISQYGGFSISGSSLVWTAIPEPATSLVGLLLVSAFLRRQRSTS